MVIRNFINRKNGLSNDSKPPASVLRTVLFFEDDTGNLFLSDGVTTTLTQGNKKQDTYQGKIIDTEKNNITNLIEDNPFSLSNISKRKGGIIPASTVTDSFYGILEDNGVTLYNADKVKTVSGIQGLAVAFQSTVPNEKVGFSTVLPVARRDENYEIKLQFKSRISLRTLIGFSATQTYPDSSSNVFGIGQIGICVGFTSSTSNFSIFTNDGIGSNQAVPVSFSVPKDQLLHTLEIKLLSDKIVCTLDSETIEVTTKLPPLTTPLYLVIYGVI